MIKWVEVKYDEIDPEKNRRRRWTRESGGPDGVEIREVKIEDGCIVVECGDATHYFPMEHIVQASVFNESAKNRPRRYDDEE